MAPTSAPAFAHAVLAVCIVAAQQADAPVQQGRTPGADAAAAAPSVTLNVDVSAQRKPISPYVYGLNFAKESFASEIGLPLRRWGGNSTSRYNWQINAINHGFDWFFHNNSYYDPYTLATQTANQWAAQNKRMGAESLITLPMVGYVARDGNQTTCGFRKDRYPVQDSWDVATGFPNCGNGYNGGVPIVNDPFDTSIPATQAFAAGWVKQLVATNGTASAGGVRFYALDNEPGLWHGTHRDVHPLPFTYDESFNRGSAYAAAVKVVDPGALILGPVQDGWARYWFASYDSQAQAEQDRTNHGGTYFLPWYLQQMNAYQQANGVRLLDYLDLHFYPQNGVDLSTAGDAAKQALRLRSVRALWDSTYVDESWIGGIGFANGIVRLIPRMRDWVNPPGNPGSGYPGTKLALTEYNWGGLEHINGALAQADILGIFGREGLDLATLWNFPQGSGDLKYDVFETLPGAYAFRMYRNYDGAGGRFGDTSVSAMSGDQAQLSIYAAQRAGDSSLTLMIINKALTTSVTGTVNIAGFSPASSAQVYRYSDANLNAIVPMPNQPVAGNSFTASYPANSITLVRVPPSAAVPPGAPFGSFDTPANGTLGLTGAIAITGWALDDTGVSKVDILRDAHQNDPAAAAVNGKVFVGSATFVTGARPDIASIYAAYPSAAHAGWGYLMLTRGVVWDDAGAFNLYAVATDTQGHVTTLGTRRVSITNSAATKPFGNIDTPAQGGSVSGSFVNFGWVLALNGRTVPAANVQVAIDGVFLPQSSECLTKRQDITDGFPTFDTTQTIRCFTIDTTKYANGVHTIGWLVTDSAGQADGIGSRFFTIANPPLTAGAVTITR